MADYLTSSSGRFNPIGARVAEKAQAPHCRRRGHAAHANALGARPKNTKFVRQKIETLRWRFSESRGRRGLRLGLPPAA